MPRVAIASSDSLNISSTVVDREVKRHGAVATMGILNCECWILSGSDVGYAVDPSVAIAGSNRLYSCRTVVDSKVESHSAVATMSIGIDV